MIQKAINKSEHEFIKYDGTNAIEIQEFINERIIGEKYESDEIYEINAMITDGLDNDISVGDYIVLDSGIFNVYQEELYVFNNEKFNKHFTIINQ